MEILKITLVKQDYLKMLDKSNKLPNGINYLLDGNEDADITEYKINDIECVSIVNYAMGCYKEFEGMQEFEELLKTAKHGYVFLRVGDGWDDIEYRNTSKLEELEFPFKFIKPIEEKANKELLGELNSDYKNYSITSKQYVFTDRESILECYEGNQEKQERCKKLLDENTQLKLVLNINVGIELSNISLYCRRPDSEKYELVEKKNILMDDALWYLGYPNEETFLADINEQNNLENNEDENEEFEPE